MRYLLDKNVVRYALVGLHHGQRRPLSVEETGALLFWQSAETHDAELFISHVSFQLLRRLTRYVEVRLMLDSVDVLFPTRYHARWARRLRETTGLSREDAAMIALASFSTNSVGTILGANWLVTYDPAMLTGYTRHLPVLHRRLQAMTTQLSTPFHQATLPELLSPDTVQFE
jgi:hypothetical protein